MSKANSATDAVRAIGFPLIVAGSYLGTSASKSGPTVTGTDPYIAINE